MKRTLHLASRIFTISLASLFVGTAYGQGYGGMGATGAGFGGAPAGGSTGGGGASTGGTGGGTSSSLFPSSGSSGSGSSSGSLFPSSSSTTSNSSSSNSSSSNSSSGSGSTGSTGASGTSIQATQIGQQLQRGEVLNRNGVGANLINSNYDVIGGQSTGNNNQFANLFSQIGRQLNQGGNFNQQGGRNAARPSIRIPLRLGFTPKPVSAPLFTARFEGRIAKLSAINSVGPIRVTMDGSTAVLQGVVATEQDRELAAGVALLEPEVENVQNALTVQQPASISDVLSAPTRTP